MIWYWKIDIVLKRYLVRLMDSELMIFDWLKIGGSFASGDIPGVLLKSAMAMIMDMDRLFHCEERSIGKTTVSILRIIQNWINSILLSTGLPSWRWTEISWILRDSYFRRIWTSFCWWMKNIYEHLKQVLDIILKMYCTDGMSKPIGEDFVFTNRLWRYGEVHAGCDFRMCVQRGMNDISKGGVKVCVPYRVTTWLWCELPFIEYLVVELDYGKMSATDLSSFDIAL